MTLSTIGYGDITPSTNAERLVSCFMMLVGALFYAFVISSVTDIVGEINRSERVPSRQGLGDGLLACLDDAKELNSRAMHRMLRGGPQVHLEQMDALNEFLEYHSIDRHPPHAQHKAVSAGPVRLKAWLQEHARSVSALSALTK